MATEPLPHDESLIGKTVRLPSLNSGRRQRVYVDTVTPLDHDSVLVMGNLLYRADNPVYEGSTRGRFVTILREGVAVEECP